MSTHTSIPFTGFSPFSDEDTRYREQCNQRQLNSQPNYLIHCNYVHLLNKHIVNSQSSLAKCLKMNVQIGFAATRETVISYPGARFSKLPIVTGPVKVFCFPFQMRVSEGLKTVQ